MMNTRRLLVVLIASGISACANNELDSSREETTATESQAITGGSEAGRGNWPSLVAISNITFSHQPWGCTGTLIAPTWVLTAGHCVSDTSISPVIMPTASNFYVRVGRYNIVTDTGGDQIVAQSIVLPANYNTVNTTPDIALIQLSRPASVAYSRLASPARMAEMPVGTLTTLLGWGETIWNTPSSLSQTLQKVVLPIAWFNSSGGNYFAPGDQEVKYYNNPVDSKGAAGGDSGGPGLVKRDNEWFVMSIASHASPGVTTEALVPTYFDWVISQGACPNPSFLPSAQIMAISSVI